MGEGVGEGVGEGNGEPPPPPPMLTGVEEPMLVAGAMAAMWLAYMR